MSETSDEVSLTVFKKKLGNFLFIGANETILRKKNQLQRRTEKLPYIFLAKMKEQALPFAMSEERVGLGGGGFPMSPARRGSVQ